MTVRESASESGLSSGLDNMKVPLNQSRHLPGHIYTSPEILALEKERVFMKDWLCMGRVEEIENPGDYMTFRVVGEPVIVVRNEAGDINAMSNVCRHRGVEVVSGEGNLKEFSCPNHGWTYDLRGQLIGAPYMKEAEGFDPQTCRLNPLRVGVWAGWIFITFGEEAEPLEDFVADFSNAFDILKQEDCRLFQKEVVEVDCNWKFVVENLMDVYHVQVLHIDSFGKYIDRQKFTFDIKKRGGFSSFFDARPDTSDGKSLFGKMPWLEDQPESFAYTGHLAPNFHLFGRIDEVHHMTTWPLGADRTRIHIYHLFPKSYYSDPDFEEKAKVYREFVLAFLEEDRWMVNSLQNAMRARRFEPGPLSRLEVNIHNRINYNLDRVFGGGS